MDRASNPEPPGREAWTLPKLLDGFNGEVFVPEEKPKQWQSLRMNEMLQKQDGIALIFRAFVFNRMAQSNTNN